MPLNFAAGFRAFCVAVALGLATAWGATARQSPLLGLSRDQLLDRLGEPKSSLAAGNREVLLFTRERVTLRNNVVVEVDTLATESTVRRSTPPPPPAETAAAPLAPADPAAPANATPPADASRPDPGAPARSAPPAAAAVPPEDAPLEIKAVRKTGVSAPKKGPTPEEIEAQMRAAEEKAMAESKAAADKAAAEARTAAEMQAAAEMRIAAEKEAARIAEERAARKAKTKKAREKLDNLDLQKAAEDEPVFSGTSYVIAGVLILGGVGYVVWRSQQRRLLLAATALSRTPFTAPAASTGTGVRFGADVIGRLDVRRFEELVAAYYNKTGVVASRTNSGPESAVHIKISWKGESRPFAFVQCIAHPTGLIGAEPLQALVTALTAEDIRRGYVVTTGKFNVPARDLAEEKHVTLLSGDIFLEKLNALPDAARNELMTELKAIESAAPSA